MSSYLDRVPPVVPSLVVIFEELLDLVKNRMQESLIYLVTESS